MADSDIMSETYNVITGKTVNSFSADNLQQDFSDGLISIDGENPTATDKITFNTDYSFVSDQISITIPTGTEITKTSGGTLDLTAISNQDVTAEINNISGGYDAPASIRFGIPNMNLTFSHPVTISLLVGNSYNGKILNVYFKNEGSNDWSAQATCAISGGLCVFQTSHATYFSSGEKAPGSSIDNSSSHKKKKKKADSKRILNSQSKIKRGQIIVESGKKFSKNYSVACEFSKPSGGYYSPKIFNADGYGKFSTSYMISKNSPLGEYQWKCFDLKTKKMSKVKKYKVVL
jgi:hypothetical protein